MTNHGMQVQYTHKAMVQAAAFISRSLPDGIALGLYNEADDGAEPAWVLIDEVASGETYNADDGAINYSWLEPDPGGVATYESVDAAIAAAPKSGEEADAMRSAMERHYKADMAAFRASTPARQANGGADWREIYNRTYTNELARLDRMAYADQLVAEAVEATGDGAVDASRAALNRACEHLAG